MIEMFLMFILKEIKLIFKLNIIINHISRAKYLDI